MAGSRTRPKRPRSTKPEAERRQFSKPVAAERPARMRHHGARLPERIGVMLERGPSDDFELIDTGNGRKLERYGDLTIDRPEAQAIWQPALADWNADATFTGDTDEEGAGRWTRRDQLGEQWPLRADNLSWYGRFTAFRHVGYFPEQLPHWQAALRAVQAANRPVKVLNLFGYTGLASIYAAYAGANVTHVDASRKAIGWGRENQALAGLDDKPIRWICEDAVKFCAREIRRGNTYDIILCDPPSFGRGPKGEVWQFFDDVPHLVDLLRQLQSEQALMTVLTSYAIRASHLAVHELMQECFAGLAGEIESGEMILRDRAGRTLSTSMFSRFLGASH